VNQKKRYYITIFIVSLGHYDKCVSVLREKQKDDMATVAASIFSHYQV